MIVTIKPLIFDRLKPDLEAMDIVAPEEEYGARGSSRHSRHKITRSDGELDLSALTKTECQNLGKLLKECGVHGSRVVAADVDKYLRASDNGSVEGMRARTVRQAAWMFEFFFKDLPHHTIFSKDAYGGNSHSGYYVGDVDYEPPCDGRGGRDRKPAMCVIDLWRIEDDERCQTKLVLLDGDVREKTCLEILADRGYVIETPKLMAALERETRAYYDVKEQIGVQYVATGLGVMDLDDALAGKNSRGYYRHNKIKMDHFGEARVVVDVLVEKDDEDSNRRGGSSDRLDPFRWHKWNMRFHSPSEDELVRHLIADEDTAELVDVDIPVHPLVPVFDLRRHTRLRVHVNNMKKYTYDREVSKNLILPDRDWQMVNLLVDHSANEFEDIVKGKGRSMNVLAAGPPGTGKTATAEVFAEFKGRPLYTIQCAQLGMDASEVEKNLGAILDRANRWNAVLLLDEADVYIAKRGVDLNQNAIVGAFLRVLEYASCILFMTTNLGDSVDDAITSRCIARLNYGPPGRANQAKIWRNLATINGLKIEDRDILAICMKHPNLTGRDVKNLLKLASFVAAGKPIDATAIEYAMQFKPTETVKG